MNAVLTCQILSDHLDKCLRAAERQRAAKPASRDDNECADASRDAGDAADECRASDCGCGDLNATHADDARADDAAGRYSISDCDRAINYNKTAANGDGNTVVDCRNAIGFGQ